MPPQEYYRKDIPTIASHYWSREKGWLPYGPIQEDVIWILYGPTEGEPVFDVPVAALMEGARQAREKNRLV